MYFSFFFLLSNQHLYILEELLILLCIYRSMQGICLFFVKIIINSIKLSMIVCVIASIPRISMNPIIIIAQDTLFHFWS